MNVAASTDLKTILVLDDDPQFHKLVVPVLTNRGHRVLSAHSGAEATEVVSQGPVDLAIVDGQLPDVTGIEWIANFRGQGNAALVMFVSAYWRDAQSYHKLTKELAVSLVLHKPVIASVFAAEVDMLLGKSAAYGDPAQRDIEDTLLALRAEYARELPARMQELSGLVSQIKSQPDNPFMVGEARTHAHKLRGTASSYGYPDIGKLAAEIEDSIVALSKDAGKRHEQLALIDAAVSKALNMAADAAHEIDLRTNLASDRSSSIDPDEPLQETAMARILVVDDDSAFLDLIDDLARRHQLEAVRATNPAEGLELACREQIDAALIDVELGSRDVAFKLAADLRLLPGYEELPLGFLSGSGHIEKTIEVDTVGHCLLFDKPTKADALEAALRQLMAIKQAWRPRVLVIDDDADFLQRMGFILAHEGMQVRTLQSSEDILREMRKFSPDLLVLDVMMPGVSGFDICRMLRTMPRWRDLPILFLTAYTDIDTRVACLKCGGDDYLLKPVVNEELLVRLQMRLDRARSLRQRLEQDNLTGLLQRHTFMNQLAAMLSEARRQNWSVTVALMAFADASGQPADDLVSDTVLAAAGNLLTKRLRPEDVKGLWGDGTIVLAFRSEQASFIDGVLRQIREEFYEMPAAEDDDAWHPRLIYTLACYPDDGSTIHELLATANRRLRGQREASASQAAN